MANSVQKRKTKKKFYKFIDILKLKSFSLSGSLRVVIIGVSIALIALFLNWFTITMSSKEIGGNGFHMIIGVTGYLLIILNILIVFFIASRKTKEAIKSLLNLDINDAHLIFILTLFGLILSINAIFILESTSFFTQGIVLGKGIIFAIVGYSLALIGSIFNLYTKEEADIFIHKAENNLEADKEELKEILDINEDNMKLPF